ncbi:LysR substrate-binding domain-containing protein [Streptosporangium sp. NBC_01756]|uniref:LysR substrate-binding domain-containing protein n=1 Tax=Streptosporangium sp. NBC_01756 TaxID=2975950 RepID=UPI002DD8A8CE|nr:LysR substrate-binding domain-containing protein [Streptosporangium sp. NBC_01756]WSC87940.1 LysR substrate-binding domain-containing protein [Streptosporangium sp. NBC_01756]
MEWQTVSALVEAGLGVSLAPASIRRIRLRGVAYRRIEPDTARTVVGMSWRSDDPNPLVARFLETARAARSGAGADGPESRTRNVLG